MKTGSRAKGGLTARQEAFALHLALGESQAEAYRQAGYMAFGNRVHEAASKLAKLPKVFTRVDEIRTARQRSLIATAVWDAQVISTMLARTYDAATGDKQHGAAATAAMGLAKLHGLLVDKTEDVTRRATRNPDAPIEIDVDHWVTEQAALLQPPQPADLEPDHAGERAPVGHGAPLLEPEPQSPQGSEAMRVFNDDGGDAEPSEGQSPQGSNGYNS